jgi:hypothetical protein
MSQESSPNKRPREEEEEEEEKGEPNAKKARLDRGERFRCVIVEMVKTQDGIVTHVVTGDLTGLTPFKEVLLEAEAISNDYSVGLSAALLEVLETKEAKPKIANLGTSTFAKKRNEVFGAAAEALQARILDLMQTLNVTCTSHCSHEDEAGSWVDHVDSFLMIQSVY